METTKPFVLCCLLVLICLAGMAQCQQKRSRTQRYSRICSLPVSRGICRASIDSYYFNQREGRCRKFSYGGCGGNENNFESLKQCQRVCGKTLPSPYTQ